MIAGKVEGDRSTQQVNRALVELFSSFNIFREPPEGTVPEELEASVDAGSAYVCPILRREVFWRLVAEYDPEAEEPAPPMEWIEAFAKSADTHE